MKTPKISGASIVGYFFQYKFHNLRKNLKYVPKFVLDCSQIVFSRFLCFTLFFFVSKIYFQDSTPIMKKCFSRRSLENKFLGPKKRFGDQTPHFQRFYLKILHLLFLQKSKIEFFTLFMEPLTFTLTPYSTHYFLDV